MTRYKPLTPELRRKIIEGIDSELRGLSECRETTYVSAYRVGYRAFKTFIRGLPDGYPIPFEKEE